MEESEMDIKGLLKRNVFPILGVLAFILNLWLYSNIAPISSNLSLVEQRVGALERLEPIGSKQYVDICARLDRIENKLDNFIFNNR